jgi:lipid-binding SYLF domain-containing protein
VKKESIMNRILLTALVSVPLLAQPEAEKRLQASATVFSEIMAAPDKGIPGKVLSSAKCIGIVPGMKKAGFIVGAKYGKGDLVCRTKGGTGWSAPSTFRVEGGSFGLQIGGGETDLVLLVMNESGMKKLLADKFTLGADATVAAGPVGREADAQTDAAMHAEILAYSRARGAFAGIALDGSTMRPDNGDNKILYGREITAQEILSGNVKAPASARPLFDVLNKYAPASATGD